MSRVRFGVVAVSKDERAVGDRKPDASAVSQHVPWPVERGVSHQLSPNPARTCGRCTGCCGRRRKLRLVC